MLLFHASICNVKKYVTPKWRFLANFGLKMAKISKIHITEAFKCQNQSTFKITPENITLSIIFDYFHA